MYPMSLSPQAGDPAQGAKMGAAMGGAAGGMNGLAERRRRRFWTEAFV